MHESVSPAQVITNVVNSDPSATQSLRDSPSKRPREESSSIRIRISPERPRNATYYTRIFAGAPRGRRGATMRTRAILAASPARGLIHRAPGECGWRAAGAIYSIIEKYAGKFAWRIFIARGMPGFIIAAKRERGRERCRDDHVVAAITQTVITQPGNKLKYALGCASSTFRAGDARKRHPANEGITPNGPIYYLYTRRGSSPASAAFSRARPRYAQLVMTSRRRVCHLRPATFFISRERRFLLTESARALFRVFECPRE